MDDDIALWVRKQRLAKLSAIINTVHRETFMRLAGHEMKSEFSALKNDMRHSMDFLSSGNPISGQLKEAIEVIEKLETENRRLKGLADQSRKVDMGEGIYLEWRDEDKWVISGFGTILTCTGSWVYEPLSSNRSDDFKERTRFTFDAAYARAQVIVEEIRHASGKK